MSDLLERLKGPRRIHHPMATPEGLIAWQDAEIERLLALCGEAALVLEIAGPRAIAVGKLSAELCAKAIELVSNLPPREREP